MIFVDDDTYRFHVVDPIHFRSRIKVTIELTGEWERGHDEQARGLRERFQ